MRSAVLTDTSVQMPTRSPHPADMVFTAELDWATNSVSSRLKILRAARHEIANMSAAFAGAVSPELARTPADTRVAEILPLLAACRFLERKAESILAPRRLGRRGLPFWLAGVQSEIHRVPLGRVLVIGPANYPLFLPGVQVLQALAAGNAVTWKPGRGGRPIADLFAQAMFKAGLAHDLLRITEESVDAGQKAMQQGADKVFFTGSALVGRVLMREMAETLTPCVMELSGCDAIVVLPSADISRVVQALVFGMRLNGSATCMAPRRILLVDATPARRDTFLADLLDALAIVNPVLIPENVLLQLRRLLDEAARGGAHVHGSAHAEAIRPIVVTNVQSTMNVAQADIFAPVLSVIDVDGDVGVLAAQEICPFALTAAIFGDEAEARRLSTKITAGSIMINDIIVPTADPRVPFGGRRQSGFGVTRGTEGLLEMTAIKTIAVRRGRSTRHYEATTAAHAEIFDGVIAATHANGWTVRWRGFKQIAGAGRKLARKG